MIETQTSYLWQMPSDIDAKTSYVSVPTDFSQALIELGLVCANKMGTNKHANTVRILMRLVCPAVSRRRHQPAAHTPILKHPLSASRHVLSLPFSRLADSFNHDFVDIGFSTPVPTAYFTSGNTSLPQVAA